MSQSDWFLLLALVVVVLLIILLAPRGPDLMLRQARHQDAAPNVLHVASIEFGSDDVLLFQLEEGLSSEHWKVLRESFENSFVGRFPEDLEGGSRRRSVFLPPGCNLNVLHLKCDGRITDGALVGRATKDSEVQQ